MSCEVQLADFVFEHVLEWEDFRLRKIKRKSVIGKCDPTVESQHNISYPKEINITARVDGGEKEALWALFRECAWHPFYDKDCSMIDYVWMEEPVFRWDNALGCGGRQWIAIIGLICSST